MQNLISLLSHLAEEDVTWLLGAGSERTIDPGQTVIREGEPPGAIYLVLEGLLEVFAAEGGERRLAVLGPGEIVGEMSLLERRAPARSVRTLETTMVLELPHAA